ncbi:LysR family transcriptional regulator [Algicola sagamiensis]|uniref:LysR family transcriptional regulator n=1 Tax=Algicola sagamiensis TaxID=163869 RepID=UPI00037041B8|nr:LysR family transcriptional regulator [Algicola sagamiensis]
MKRINYNHLYYFYVVAQEGNIKRASLRLNVTSQTVSSQIATMEDYLGRPLFDRLHKQFQLNEVGTVVYQYAQDIFSLGEELRLVLHHEALQKVEKLTIGFVDVIPKVMAFDILKPCFQTYQAMRIVSREGDLPTLIAEMALNRIDLIISDQPVGTEFSVKVFSKFLGESGFSFFAEPRWAEALKVNFPYSLNHQPFLIPGDKSVQKNLLLAWFESLEIAPNIIGEFEDSALMKLFGKEGIGIFCSPTSIEDYVKEQFSVEVIGKTTEVTERFYAISPERKIKHPALDLLLQQAKNMMD